jgi:hypothetical protein
MEEVKVLFRNCNEKFSVQGKAITGISVNQVRIAYRYFVQFLADEE